MNVYNRGQNRIDTSAAGLARNAQDYRRHLAECDFDRRNDLDGRGTLSEEALLKSRPKSRTLAMAQLDNPSAIV
jgi:hypothetical protein